MTSRLPSLLRLATLGFAFAFLAILAPAPVAAAQPFTKDLYFAAGYVRQIDGRTCTAASTSMMMNFIAGRSLGLSQMEILNYAQPIDALNDRVQRGSDPLGWSKVATQYSAIAGLPTTYKWAAYPTKASALKAAALAIATYNKPVGLAVWNGKHAIVMTGFSATADPTLGAFTLKTVITSDPYWKGGTVGKHRTWSATGMNFPRYTEMDANKRFDKNWYGRYVIVFPTD